MEELARRLGIERTYCGRILAGERTPGLALRIQLRDDLGISLDSWDEKVPDSDHPASKPAA